MERGKEIKREGGNKRERKRMRAKQIDKEEKKEVRGERENNDDMVGKQNKVGEIIILSSIYLFNRQFLVSNNS